MYSNPSAKLCHEGFQQPEVVGAVGIAHQNVLAANVRNGVDVGAPQAALRRLQYTGSAPKSALGRAVGPTVHNEDLAANIRGREALPAPAHELGDVQLFVQCRDHNGNFRVCHVIRRDVQINLAVHPGNATHLKSVLDLDRHLVDLRLI